MFNVSQRCKRAALAWAPFTPLKGLYSGPLKGAKGPYNRRPSVRYGLNSLSIKFLKIYEIRLSQWGNQPPSIEVTMGCLDS